MHTAMAAGALFLSAAAVMAQTGFTDHGVGTPLAERRGVVATRDANGKYVAVACSTDLSPRRWLLVTDIDSGDTTQVWCPEGVPTEGPYGSLLASNGRFYTGAGRTLLEFDVTARDWTFHGIPVPGASAYLRLIEGPDGLIYGGAYGTCHLVSFDPGTRQMRDCGVMDPEQKYLHHLAYDDAGWIYCGIGTARCNIVAYNTATGQHVQLIDEAERKIGTASVSLGPDGKVYGKAASQWYKLYEGKATAIDGPPEGIRSPAGSIYWGDVAGDLPDGRKVTAYDMEAKYIEVREAEGGQTRRIAIDYESEGSVIRVIAGGPDGKVYAASAHPSRAIVYNPQTDEMLYQDGSMAWKSIAFQGNHLMGNVYGGGKLYLFDITKPWKLTGEADERNPRLAVAYAPDINVPWGALAHPDGKHLLMAGQPGYGHRGGGVGIYNTETGESTLLKHTDLIPEHSTVTLQALRGGNVIAGTTVAGGHGATAAASEGVLYILDWATRKVTYQTVPVGGASEMKLLQLGPDGLVYGLTSNAHLFVFDPAERKVLRRQDLSEHGSPVVNGLGLAPDGNIYAVLTGAIIRIEPGAAECEKIGEPPGGASAGIALLDDRLYFGIGSHLWSYELPR